MFGAVAIRFEQVGSTNDVALRLARQGLPEGTIVTAKEQKHGRGRRGREWASPIGGLFLSIVVRPKALASLLPIAAGVATARTIRRLFGLKATLKWPNDVMIQGRKIAGVLVESSITTRQTYVVVGFGVNVNNACLSMPIDLRESVTSIVDHSRSEVDTERLVRELLDEFSSAYSKVLLGDHTTVIKQWKELTDMLGKEVLVHEEKNVFSAIPLDLDPEGALVVQTRDNVVRKLLSADVSLHKAQPIKRPCLLL